MVYLSHKVWCVVVFFFFIVSVLGGLATGDGGGSHVRVRVGSARRVRGTGARRGWHRDDAPRARCGGGVAPGHAVGACGGGISRGWRRVSGSFRRVGGTEVIDADVRVIAATNRDLAAQVALGRFREDLYYRLNVVPVQIPPLRQRREDIALLIRYFTDHYNRRYNSYKRFSEKLIGTMTAMPWKGNIRELENVVERMIVTSTASEIDSLGPIDHEAAEAAGESKTLVDLIQEYEDTLLIRAMKEHRTTRKIAIHYGMSQPTVARKIKNLRQRRQIERL